MENCQVDNNASSTGDNKAIMQNHVEAEVSTVSSERVHSAQQSSIRSDVSSETGQPFNEKRKDPDVGRPGQASQGDAINKVLNLPKRLKTDSSSSKESSEVVQQSSVDSTDPKPCHSSNEISAQKKPIQTESNESRTVVQERESSMTTKLNPVATRVQTSHRCEFDLNEGLEVNGAECHGKLLHEINSSVLHVSKPIRLVAKVGVPLGLPKKPLQFGGELGWRSSATSSAFSPTFFKNPDREKGTSVSKGMIDLNIAATMDSELSADMTSVDVSSKQQERFLLDLNTQSENDEDHHKPGAPGFDLNDNPMIEDTRTNIHPHGESHHLPKFDTATCSGGSAHQSISDPGRPSHWVDLSSVRGFGHVQAQPLFLGAPGQVQMVVPIQSEISFLPRTPSGLYIGKFNNLSPTFYPPNILPHLNTQHGAAAMPQMSGSFFAAYPHPHENMNPIFLPHGSIARNGEWKQGS